MKRTHPLFTLPGLILTAIILIGLALGVFLTGGQAFSPGHLSDQGDSARILGGYTSHASFEKECRLCHAPLQTTQDQLCLECHTTVAEQIQTKTGTHSLVEQVNQCYLCHSEHQGKNFDPLLSSLDRFDHNQTGFSLNWHQVDYNALPMNCQACHTFTPQFTLDTGSCASCHSANDASFMLKHISDYGTNCLACHDGKDSLANFEHTQTGFPLEGTHTELRCNECHTAMTSQGSEGKLEFQGLASDCASCHSEPQSHIGLFGLSCQDCHTSQSWSPARWKGAPFEHFTSTGFSLARHALDYSGLPIQCKDCHTKDLDQNVVQACVNCHGSGGFRTEFILEHQRQFGAACLDCHDGVDRFSNFNHALYFPLDGAHLELSCDGCHANQVFSGTPNTCVACHAEPEIHAGFFGLECQSCHTTQAWHPAQLRNHTFPLDHGGQGLVECETCHPSSYVAYTCYGCHEHEPARIQEKHVEENISIAELANCVQCHPTGQEAEEDE